jgi:hypothetical protein
LCAKSKNATSDLLDQRREGSAVEPDDVVTIGRRETRRKKELLVGLLTGREPQPRDATGRFARRPAGSFDGGARPIAPTPATAERAHANLLGSLVAASRVYLGC